MAWIDMFAFGGGLAALPLMFQEVVVVHSWLDSTTFLNGLALGQVTPGPIVITATFVGFLVVWLLGRSCRNNCDLYTFISVCGRDCTIL